MKDLVKTKETKWTSKKELMEICKCSNDSLERAISDLTCLIGAATQNHIKKDGYRNSEIFYDDYLVKLIQAKLFSNQANQGRASDTIKQEIHDIVDNSEYKYTKEDICSICNCSVRTFENFAPQELSERYFIVV